MRLNNEAKSQPRVGVSRRKKQLVQETLLSLAKTNDWSIMEAVQIECVSVKGQQRELVGFRIELLAVAIYHNDARSGRRIGEEAAFSEDGHGTMRLTVVVDKQSDDFAPLVAAADIDREFVRDCC